MRFDGKKPIEFSDDTVKLEQDNLEETKYVLKGSAPSTDSSFEEPIDEPDLDFGGEEGGEEDLDLDLGGEEGGSEKPFDDEPFDAGVEADEDTDPEKYIQQLSGKLGQSLRQHSDDTGEPDFDLEKFAVNSVLSATHTGEMDREDQKDIIKKVKGSGTDDDMGDIDEPNGDENFSDEEEPSGDEELDFGEEGLEEDGGRFSNPKINRDYKELEDNEEWNKERGEKDWYDVSHSVLDDLESGEYGKDWDDRSDIPPASPSHNKPNPFRNIQKNEANSMWDKDPNFQGEKSRFGKDDQWESYLQESEKNGIFVNRDKVINDLRLMENEEPTIAPKPAVKPSVKPARPLRETDRPFSPKRRTHVQPDPKAESDSEIINDEEDK